MMAWPAESSCLFRSFWPHHYLEAHLEINHDGLTSCVISLFNVIARYWPVIADCSYILIWIEHQSLLWWHWTNMEMIANGLFFMIIWNLATWVGLKTSESKFHSRSQVGQTQEGQWDQGSQHAFCGFAFLTWSDMVLSWNKRCMIDWADDKW